MKKLFSRKSAVFAGLMLMSSLVTPLAWSQSTDDEEPETPIEFPATLDQRL